MDFLSFVIVGLNVDWVILFTTARRCTRRLLAAVPEGVALFSRAPKLCAGASK